LPFQANASDVNGVLGGRFLRFSRDFENDPDQAWQLYIFAALTLHREYVPRIFAGVDNIQMFIYTNITIFKQSLMLKQSLI